VIFSPPKCPPKPSPDSPDAPNALSRGAALSLARRHLRGFVAARNLHPCGARARGARFTGRADMRGKTYPHKPGASIENEECHPQHVDCPSLFHVIQPSFRRLCEQPLSLREDRRKGLDRAPFAGYNLRFRVRRVTLYKARTARFGLAGMGR
jgi:hypothetical protein